MTIETGLWSWPQWAIVAVFVFDLIIYATLSGKPKTGTYNFALKLADIGLLLFILISGGFFK